jgi:hypothetical protein
MPSRRTFVECSFLIPVTRDRVLSDGEPHSPVDRFWFKEQLFARFGGATVAPGEYEGFYSDPDTGEMVSDRSVRYVVAVPRKQLNELRSLLAEACLVFYQKCIYISVGGNVEFVTPTRRRGP